ncbi:RNA 2'-phosphotransferase [Nonomuraea sediminis]|uniref:RNA 2'-phosphotransferase n=1 Tax=Nonomuraea sediminis TaxID=2835864 RepID=UPI001BDC479D|nr:RNA 2'-phosphotransferase [Nonomuraea sediminis]
MQQKRLVRISKYLAKHLRHEPERIGIHLDAHGWVAVDTLLSAAAAHGFPITREELDEVVGGNDKRRYTVEDGLIRANQGHSVEVDLDLESAVPPALLYHGTVGRFLPSILTEGLRPMARHHVHLSPDVETATKVGSRRGAPVILTVDAAAMHAGGHVFHRSANGVWLTAHVPPPYLRVRGIS